MASAAAPKYRSELPSRRPVASESGSETTPAPSARQAFGSDVVGSELSPKAQLGYRVLADHVNRGRDARRPYDGQVFLTDETFAAELGGVSKRQVQRIRSELLAGGWICLPKGDAGGRGNSTIWYHLHADGRPCAHASTTVLKQRAAAENANLRRGETLQLGGANRVCGNNEDRSDSLCPSPAAAKDDSRVILSRQRMTKSTTKDDRTSVKDDKIGIPYKEELLQELIPELRPTMTASNRAEEFPADFAKLMDSVVVLDDGALERLWNGARALVPDATAEEIHVFFESRARNVYRSRRLENPTGLMISSIRDWFPKRRVLEWRKQCLDAAEACRSFNCS